jgi:hypothetical protein
MVCEWCGVGGGDEWGLGVFGGVIERTVLLQVAGR